MGLFAFIGVAVTAATPLIFQGETVSDPVQLLARLGSPLVSIVAMLALSLATLSTNIAANVVSPANDISNLYPEKISYRMGGYITALIGFAIMPWKLLASAGTYLFVWLVGYSALLGPIGGVMIVDYFLLRKGSLAVDELYKRNGAYTFKGGFHWGAIVATVLAVLPNLPGFLYTLDLTSLNMERAAQKLAPLSQGQFIEALAKQGSSAGFVSLSLTLYSYAWFVGFLLAGLLYFLLADKKAIAAGRAA
jgi:NCS1 family nucleobase:cation symporter-1